MISTEPLEGVTKFEADHRSGVLPGSRFGQLFAELQAWRQILFQLNLIGQDPSRYEGAGYGNVSARVPPHGRGRGQRAFLVTGTQTGGRGELSLNDYCVVERYDVVANRVVSSGQASPSSESMTHGSLYDANPGIRFVFHGHIPLIWRNAKRLKLPCTQPTTAYGTVEMAREVSDLYRSSTLHEKRVLAMLGHEDGIVSFGRTASEAGGVLVNTLAEALALEQCQTIPALGCRFD